MLAILLLILLTVAACGTARQHFASVSITVTPRVTQAVSLPPALQAHTATRNALNLTATYLATYPTPHPSMTFIGECFMGSSASCTAEAPRLFAATATRLAIEGTYVMWTLTPP